MLIPSLGYQEYESLQFLFDDNNLVLCSIAALVPTYFPRKWSFQTSCTSERVQGEGHRETVRMWGSYYFCILGTCM